MAPSDPPWKRSIGLAGLVRFLVALSAVLAVGAAFAAERYALGGAGLAFILVALVLWQWALRARR